MKRTNVVILAIFMWMTLLFCMTLLAANESEQSTDELSTESLDLEGISEQIGKNETESIETTSGFEPYYDTIKNSVNDMLEQLTSMTDDELVEMMLGTDESVSQIAAMWYRSKKTLGNYQGIKSQVICENAPLIMVDSMARYELISEPEVVHVFYIWDTKSNENQLYWFVYKNEEGE